MQWDIETDVIVVGSGAGGMGAGIFSAIKKLDCVVLEKTEKWGGTTAMSGGVVWVPNHAQMHEVDIPDSADEAWSYLEKVSGEVNQQRLRAFVDAAPKMLALLREQSQVRYSPMPAYMDYYPEFHGFKSGGRSMEPEPVNVTAIGDARLSVRRPTNQGVLNTFSVTAVEGQALSKFTNKAYWILFKRLLAYWLDLPMRLKGREDRRQTMGRALVIRLRKSLQDKNVPLHLNAEVAELIRDEQGAVIGARAEIDGSSQNIRARRGVILASGGFANNAELRRKYHYEFVGTDWTAAAPGDTGDAVALGQAVGADLEHMKCAWWTPTYQRPDGVSEALIAGKSMPGSLFVNSAGKRFVNEAKPYEELTKIQLRTHEQEGNCIPCFMIIDANYRHNYPVGPIGPAKAQPDLAVDSEMLSDKFLVKAESLEALADKLGIDTAGLSETIKRFNEFAVSGKDLDFQRGDSVHDRYYADPKVEPNPSLAPLLKAPYYGLRIYPGDLSTKGGLKCNEHGNVVDTEGVPIKGLYASGNCSGAVFGDSYPGAGATIASALTFSYLAVEHIADSA